uniref:Putative mitotic checkpoint protein prcc n=1 Tax=Corethrella appendiculata TaxID=1370023 RepID=U5ERC1_9DIPT
MSLVAYDASSDEESDEEEIVEENTDLKSEIANKKNRSIEISSNFLNQLPAPKTSVAKEIIEEDDEFLRKKEIPVEKPTPFVVPQRKNGKVQITIPALRDFKDDADDTKAKVKETPIIGASLPPKKSGLLDLLPKPKLSVIELKLPAAFSKLEIPTASSSTSKPVINKLIPDSVAKRGNHHTPAKTKKSEIQKPQTIIAQYEDSSDDEDDQNDFFSFNQNNDKLPEISTNEINAMVAKKQAKILETANILEKSEPPISDEQINFQQPSSSYVNQRKRDQPDDAIRSLIGGNKAKRSKIDHVNFIDISANDIIPTREEYERKVLKGQTEYVATGNLTGDWTCTSKRKSHVTHLAAKAIANESELEAMWASNRHSRRETQSKYGF